MRIEILLIAILFFIIGALSYSQSMSADADDGKYKAPLRQIHDDGVSPKDVKCNEGKVLFFKISNRMPVCIYEKSIEHFSNDWIGWFGVHNESFLTHYDLEYLKEKQRLLEKSTTVTYSIDHDQNIVYSVQERITNIDENSVIHDPEYEDGLYEIVDENGNDPVDWDDPRTSIGAVSGLEDLGKSHNLRCDGKWMDFYELLSKESSFKISKGTEIVFLNYKDRVLIQDYDQNEDKEFTHAFWSQGKTEFVFEDNIKEMDVTERVCETNSLSKIYLYKVTFRVPE